MSEIERLQRSLDTMVEARVDDDIAPDGTLIIDEGMPRLGRCLGVCA